MTRCWCEHDKTTGQSIRIAEGAVVMSVVTTVDQIVDPPVAYCWTRNGIYYFTRRVPADLKHHYSTNRIVMTLKTRLRSVALKRARKIAEQLERFWESLRWDRDDVPGKQYLKGDVDRVQTQTISAEGAVDQTVDHPTLVEAKAIYVRLKGAGKNKQFHQTTDRAVEAVSNLISSQTHFVVCGKAVVLME